MEMSLIKYFPHTFISNIIPLIRAALEDNEIEYAFCCRPQYRRWVRLNTLAVLTLLFLFYVDKKSKCHARLVHKLLSQYIAGNPPLKEKYPTRRYLPQVSKCKWKLKSRTLFHFILSSSTLHLNWSPDQCVLEASFLVILHCCWAETSFCISVLLKLLESRSYSVSVGKMADLISARHISDVSR